MFLPLPQHKIKFCNLFISDFQIIEKMRLKPALDSATKQGKIYHVIFIFDNYNSMLQVIQTEL